MDATQPQYTFTFYRFVTSDGRTTTKVVRDLSDADGMRGLITKNQLQEATQRVNGWASSKGISTFPQPLYPSAKYPGRMWLDFRFGGLTL
jgi:hypothetical protein